MRIWKVISPKLVRNSNVKTWLSYRVPGPTYEQTAFVNFHSLRMAPTSSSMHLGPIKSLGVPVSPCPATTSQQASCCLARMLPLSKLLLCTPQLLLTPTSPESHYAPACSSLPSTLALSLSLVLRVILPGEWLLGDKFKDEAQGRKNSTYEMTDTMLCNKQPFPLIDTITLIGSVLSFFRKWKLKLRDSDHFICHVLSTLLIRKPVPCMIWPSLSLQPPCQPLASFTLFQRLSSCHVERHSFPTLLSLYLQLPVTLKVSLT